MNNRTENGIWIVVLGVCVGILALTIGSLISLSSVDHVITYKPWFIQAPFGSGYGDVNGHLVWGSGVISTSPAESYTIKYFVGEELRSLTVDATNTPIIANGSFLLVETKSYHVNLLGWEINEPFQDKFVIYLPSLPENITAGTFG